MHPNNSMEDYDNVVCNILHKITVKILPICIEHNIIHPSVNLYLELPGRSDVRRAAIINKVQKIQFRTAHFGRGHISPGWICTMCRAIDHLTGLRPFSLLPDWNLVTRKPKATTKPDQGPPHNTTHNTHQRGQGRGGHPNTVPNRRGQQSGGYRGRGQQRN